jgi:hypothetical protein
LRSPTVDLIETFQGKVPGLNLHFESKGLRCFHCEGGFKDFIGAVRFSAGSQHHLNS